MSNLSLTERLAAFVTSVQPGDLPDPVLDAARYYTLDWLGAALAGTSTAEGCIFLDYAAAREAGPATVIGLDARRSAETAALANGALSHIVEMDDLHRASVLHPGAAVIPAALAVAEQEGAGGLALLTAIVLGYEVAIRVGEAVGKSHYRYWHNTATCGVFGAAAAAGRLQGLSCEQMAWALGSAGTMAAGLWEFNAEGAMSKPLHAGRAAAGGVLAADLAWLGLTGARHILEGERGLFAATSADALPERVIDGLRPDMATYRIEGVSIKPHASCRHTHPAVDAALAIRARVRAAAASIESVIVETYQAALDLTSNPAPDRPAAAKFSLPYCVASALWRGSAGLGDFTPAAIADPDVRSLMGRVELRHSPELEARYPAQWPARVTARLADGAELEQAVEYAKGDPENPLSWAELTAKFLGMASGTVYEADASALAGRVRGLARQEPDTLDGLLPAREAS